MAEQATAAQWAVELSQDEVQRYRDDGLLVPNYRLPDDMVARMRQSLLDLFAANGHISSNVMYGPHIPYNPGQDLKGDPIWLDYAKYPPLLDLMEQLIGPDFLLWGTTVFGKPAGGGKAVPWHQDGEYWPIEPLSNVSVWIALDDCTPENGCLRFIPGSHKPHRLYSHHNDASEALLIHEVIDDDEYDHSRARDLPLRAGEMAIFDVFTVHGSHANTTSQRRAGFVLRIMPTTSHFNHSRQDVAAKTTIIDWANRPLHLLRGRDACGRNDFQVGH